MESKHEKAMRTLQGPWSPEAEAAVLEGLDELEEEVAALKRDTAALKPANDRLVREAKEISRGVFWGYWRARLRAWLTR